MVAYNFQPEFAEAIVAGSKVSTIRPARARGHARPGQVVHLFIGLRGKSGLRLLEAPCVACEPVEIHEAGMVVSGEPLADVEQLDTIARRDGFTGFGNMQAWFERRYGLPALGLTRITWDRAGAGYVAPEFGGAGAVGAEVVA